MKRFLLVASLGLAGLALNAQIVRRPIVVPDIPGYTTLKGDMHIHTVFSDGKVWPVTRVDEAVLEGLDYIAITDHVDGRHMKMVNAGLFNCDRDKSYQIAKDYAKGTGVIVIHGGEITRGMPPGHCNATFIKDNDAIGDASDAHENHFDGMMAGLKVAREQGGFLVWNHPHWSRQAPNKTEWHKENGAIYDAGLMDGIEIFNQYDGYSPEAHHWAVEKNLTVISGTDAHYLLSNWLGGAMRPVNLTFVKERNTKGIREALDARRNAVFAEGKVYGPEEFLRPLVDAILAVESIKTTPKKITVKIHNGTSIPVVLEKSGGEKYGYTRVLEIAPGADYPIVVTPAEYGTEFTEPSVDITYKVTNFFVDAGVPLEYSVHVDR